MPLREEGAKEEGAVSQKLSLELTLLNFWNAPNKHLLGEAETKIQNYYASVGNGGPTEA